MLYRRHISISVAIYCASCSSIIHVVPYVNSYRARIIYSLQRSCLLALEPPAVISLYATFPPTIQGCILWPVFLKKMIPIAATWLEQMEGFAGNKEVPTLSRRIATPSVYKTEHYVWIQAIHAWIKDNEG